MKRNKRKKPETVKVGNIAVKIYTRTKPTGYTVHEVADYSTGTRRLRSFSDHQKARKEAERIARLMSAGETTAAAIRNPQAASYGRAIELLRPTGIPLELVAGHFAEAVKILGSDRIIEAAQFFKARNPDTTTTKTVAEVVAEMIAVKEARGASKPYLSDLHSRLGRFAEAFKVPIASVTTGDVQKWLDGIKGATETLKNFRRITGTLFRFAEARGYIAKRSSPVPDTERIENGISKPVTIYTPEEMARLLTAAPPDAVPCLAIAAFAGLRSAEIMRLDWREVHLPEKFIELTAEKAKTAARRIVPISDNLAAWLAPHVKTQGRIWKARQEELFIAYREAAAATQTPAQAAVVLKRNACRHSFSSYRLAEIQNAAQVALEAGNSPQMVFKHYRELVKPTEAKRWFAIQPTTAANVVNLQAAAA